MALSVRNWSNDNPPAIDETYLNELDTEVRRLDTAKVGKTGSETISGIKTFSSSPIVPTPETDFEVATKQYVDEGVIQEVTPGSNIAYRDDIEISTGSTIYTKRKGVKIPYSGTYNVSFALSGPGTYNLFASAKIYVNGVAVGTERSTTSVTYITYTEDITVISGDEIAIYGKSQNSSFVGYIKEFRLIVNEVYDYIKTT